MIEQFGNYLQQAGIGHGIAGAGLVRDAAVERALERCKAFCVAQARRRMKPVLRIPARVTHTFPERSSEWDKRYPTLIKPWLGGVRAYWLVEQQAFQLQSGTLVRVDGIEPNIPDGIMDLPAQNVLGEFYAKGKSYEEVLAMVQDNAPIDALSFYIFDAELEEAAVERAKYCLQVPRDYDGHVSTVDMYQVNTPGGFRTYLDVWRKQGYPGSIAVGYQDPWLSTEYEVRMLL